MSSVRSTTLRLVARRWAHRLGLFVLSSSCHSADGFTGGPCEAIAGPVDSAAPATIAAAATSAGVSKIANEVANPRRRAWPVPLPARGLTFLASVAPSGSHAIASGPAALQATADRCPDHLECERIANNVADAARYGCSAQCDACCLHASIASCVDRECSGAIVGYRDDGRSGDFGDLWKQACSERCRVEMSACTGCRSVWCGEGAAVAACHADVERAHRESLNACDRDCPAAERREDGSCTISCGSAKASCSQHQSDCRKGKSPDCRCECIKSAAGVCLEWKEVCTCD